MTRLFKVSVLFGAFIAFPCSAKPQILASIKPLALIANEVAGIHADVATLLPIAASPHDYPLRMSDHQRLRNADIVLWVGPELESFLRRPLENIDAGKILTIHALPELQWPQIVNHQDSHYDHVTHHHEGKDPHVWLDPINAIVIAHALAHKLSELEPDAKAAYEANANHFAKSMQLLNRHLGTRLNPIKSKPFVVYHEGYSHFVNRYGLHQIAYITYVPERRPGARHLKEIEMILQKEGKCSFVEPYYTVESTKGMAEKFNLKIATLDPIGDQQVSSYWELMDKLGQNFLTCLTDGGDQ